VAAVLDRLPSRSAWCPADHLVPADQLVPAVLDPAPSRSA